MRKLWIAAGVMLLASCAAMAGGVNEKAMSRAAADVHRLSNAVQGEVWRGAEPGSDLAALACGRDPALCGALSEFSVLVKREGDNALLLLCTKDKRRALLEDIACTPRIDFTPWEKGMLPCQFTLNATEACN